MPAGREELSPLVQGGRSWCEENMVFFEEARSAGLAGDVTLEYHYLRPGKTRQVKVR